VDRQVLPGLPGLLELLELVSIGRAHGVELPPTLLMMEFLTMDLHIFQSKIQTQIIYLLILIGGMFGFLKEFLDQLDLPALRDLQDRQEQIAQCQDRLAQQVPLDLAALIQLFLDHQDRVVLLVRVEQKVLEIFWEFKYSLKF
jgi:hypothetical protein